MMKMGILWVQKAIYGVTNYEYDEEYIVRKLNEKSLVDKTINCAKMGVEILYTSFSNFNDSKVVPNNVFLGDGGDSTVALGELDPTPGH